MVAERFAGRIGPGPLLEWVGKSCPWLVLERRPGGPAAQVAQGWNAVLAAGHTVPASARPKPAARVDYFALCLAAHHLTVGSFCPTDVDVTIRHARWQEDDRAALARQEDVLRAALTWTVDGIDPRRVDHRGRPVTGHDGEYLGVLAGCLGAWLRVGDIPRAEGIVTLIEAELARESEAFTEAATTPGRELDALRLAALVTHNVGDLDQGQSHWAPGLGAPYRARWWDLAKDPSRYGGVFARAAHVYRQTLATEGHRNYPLRQVKALRVDPSLWLPNGPFFDAWGRLVATTPLLNDEARLEVLGALLHGVATIKNQQAYQRAIAGFASAVELATWTRQLPQRLQEAVHLPTVQAALAEDEVAFTQRWVGKARGVLGSG